jgi:hypothetical protein
MGWMILPGLLLGAGGCLIAGYAASVYGDPVVPAVYVPGKTPMLVMVVDEPDPTGMKVESDTVAREIEQQIQRHQIAPLVPATKVDQFKRTNLAGFSTLPPAEVGRAVGADQVLFVQIQSSRLSAGATGDMLKGEISTTVSIIDAPSGRTLWPNDGSDGAAVSFSTPTLRETERNTPLAVSRLMYAGLADRTVKLFRRYKPDIE